jgi:thymidylate kinase
MKDKPEVYLLRIQHESNLKISLREVGKEESHAFESLEALCLYLNQRLEQHETTSKDSNKEQVE